MTDIAVRRDREVRALTSLGMRELATATSGVHTVHRAVSDRVFALLGIGLGDLGRAVKPAHDAITDGVYAVISGTLAEVGGLAGQVAVGRGRPPSETPKGAFVLGVVNGLIGDALAAEASPLAESMSVRVDNAAVAVRRSSLDAAFPDASERVVVFLHGLMETENAWRLGDGPGYGRRLHDDLDYSEVQIRYNTGRHISENGRELATLLQDLVSQWPVPVRTLTLVGHSMGGLVMRSACHQGADENAPWVQRVRHTICLGTPHLGAPMAQAVHYASAGLHAFPESRPFAQLLRRRSGGIRDLQQGSLVDDDWRDSDLDALRSRAVREIPLLPHAVHSFVSATVTADARHPLGRVIGDGLVLSPSASGRNRARRIGFSDDAGLAIGSANHFTLLNNDAVYDWLVERLRPLPELPPARVYSATLGAWV
ncbi:lipase family alpha/beta hydrolase [Williamsia sterculiae]|uniref:PGAP1-like protein n=1 Tax=Williamsia sterculiae TaxID=1344003 RepID=A0A1N7H2C0_9NOCA|nr:alpha/beta hydrolase [Williamsia sterculiae]SIS18975.1 PGAP1-like protein [Williamsia sterculiae]